MLGILIGADGLDYSIWVLLELKSLFAQAYLRLVMNGIFSPQQCLMPCENQNMGQPHLQPHHGTGWITMILVFYLKTICTGLLIGLLHFTSIR